MEIDSRGLLRPIVAIKGIPWDPPIYKIYFSICDQIIFERIT